MAATSNGTLGIYDSGVLRGTAISFSAYALQVNGTTSEIYAGGSGSYAVYTYSASGLTQNGTTSNENYASPSNDDMQVAGGVLYTDFGTADNAETGAVLGTFYLNGTTIAQGPAVADTTLGRVFILDNQQGYYYSGYNQIQVFDLAEYNLASASTILVSVSTPSNNNTSASKLTRWGTNGLAFRTSAGVDSVRSNLVKDESSVNADLGATLAASRARQQDRLQLTQRP